ERVTAQLHQSQKLEALGTLAGGIAHDFNNMLGAVLGYGELAIKHTEAASPSRRYLDNILVAATRARDQVACAGCGDENVVEVTARRAGGFGVLDRKLAVAEHRAQHVVEVVGDAAREGPERLELLGLMQLCRDALVALQLAQKSDQQDRRESGDDEGAGRVLPRLRAPDPHDPLLGAPYGDERRIPRHAPQTDARAPEYRMLERHMPRLGGAQCGQGAEPGGRRRLDPAMLAADQGNAVGPQQLDGAAGSQVQCM